MLLIAFSTRVWRIYLNTLATNIYSDTNRINCSLQMYLNMVHVKFVCANISGHLFMNVYICILKYSTKKLSKYLFWHSSTTLYEYIQTFICANLLIRIYFYIFVTNVKLLEFDIRNKNIVENRLFSTFPPPPRRQNILHTTHSYLFSLSFFSSWLILSSLSFASALSPATCDESQK